MFPFQQIRNEIVFGSRTDMSTDNYISFVDDDLIMDYANFDPLLINIDYSNNTQKQKNQKELGNTNDDQREILKKDMHRDMEKRRREQMSKLYASLRSLLPLEHKKGKWSISDDMQDAVNYTKQLQKKVQELKTRREMLKNLSTSSGTNKKTTSSNIHNNLPNSCVTLNMMGKDEMEILISSCTSSINTTPEFRLSRVIKELHGKELNVVSCVSTKINGGFLHKIQAEFRDLRLIDVSLLQEKLAEVIN